MARAEGAPGRRIAVPVTFLSFPTQAARHRTAQGFHRRGASSPGWRSWEAPSHLLLFGAAGLRCNLLCRRPRPAFYQEALLPPHLQSLRFSPTAGGGTSGSSGNTFMWRPRPYLLLIPLVIFGLVLVIWGSGAPSSNGKTTTSPVAQLAQAPAQSTCQGTPASPSGTRTTWRSRTSGGASRQHAAYDEATGAIRGQTLQGSWQGPRCRAPDLKDRICAPTSNGRFAPGYHIKIYARLVGNANNGSRRLKRRAASTAKGLRGRQTLQTNIWRPQGERRAQELTTAMGRDHGDTSGRPGPKSPRAWRQGRHGSVGGPRRNASSLGAAAVADHIRAGSSCNRGCRLAYLECDAGARSFAHSSGPSSFRSGRDAEQTPRWRLRSQFRGSFCSLSPKDGDDLRPVGDDHVHSRGARPSSLGCGCCRTDWISYGSSKLHSGGSASGDECWDDWRCYCSAHTVAEAEEWQRRFATFQEPPPGPSGIGTLASDGNGLYSGSPSPSGSDRPTGGTNWWRDRALALMGICLAAVAGFYSRPRLSLRGRRNARWATRRGVASPRRRRPQRGSFGGDRGIMAGLTVVPGRKLRRRLCLPLSSTAGGAQPLEKMPERPQWCSTGYAGASTSNRGQPVGSLFLRAVYRTGMAISYGYSRTRGTIEGTHRGHALDTARSSGSVKPTLSCLLGSGRRHCRAHLIWAWSRACTLPLRLYSRSRLCCTVGCLKVNSFSRCTSCPFLSGQFASVKTDGCRRRSCQARCRQAPLSKVGLLLWLSIWPCHGVQIWQQGTVQGQPVFTTSGVREATHLRDIQPARVPNAPIVEPLLRAGPMALRTICVYRLPTVQQPTVLVVDDRAQWSSSLPHGVLSLRLVGC